MDRFPQNGEKTDQILHQRSTDLEAVAELKSDDFANTVKVEHLTKGSIMAVSLAEFVVFRAELSVTVLRVGIVQP